MNSMAKKLKESDIREDERAKVVGALSRRAAAYRASATRAEKRTNLESMKNYARLAAAMDMAVRIVAGM